MPSQWAVRSGDTAGAWGARPPRSKRARTEIRSAPSGQVERRSWHAPGGVRRVGGWSIVMRATRLVEHASRRPCHLPCGARITRSAGSSSMAWALRHATGIDRRNLPRRYDPWTAVTLHS